MTDNVPPTPGNANLPIGALNRADQEPGASPWRSRGYLPHFDDFVAAQNVTYHLADSLPASVLKQLDAELRALPPTRRATEQRLRVEAWIDAGHGSCVLGDPAVAAAV